MDPNVPLVVPEINPRCFFTAQWNYFKSNTQQSLLWLLSLLSTSFQKIESIVASTYQATSGAGAAGPKEMYDQSKEILEAREQGRAAIIEPKVFQHQVTYNPDSRRIGDFDSEAILQKK